MLAAARAAATWVPSSFALVLNPPPTGSSAAAAAAAAATAPTTDSAAPLMHYSAAAGEARRRMLQALAVSDAELVILGQGPNPDDPTDRWTEEGTFTHSHTHTHSRTHTYSRLHSFCSYASHFSLSACTPTDLSLLKANRPRRRVLCAFSCSLTGPSGPAWEPELDAFHAEYSRCLAAGHAGMLSSRMRHLPSYLDTHDIPLLL